MVSTKTRNVLFTLLGVLGLLLKGPYSGPQMVLVYSYGGNLSVSFAVYFMITHVSMRYRYGRLLTAVLALAAVDLFEATDGFHLLSNTYDPFDFLANAAGVALALCLDTVVSRLANPTAVAP